MSHRTLPRPGLTVLLALACLAAGLVLVGPASTPARADFLISSAGTSYCLVHRDGSMYRIVNQGERDACARADDRTRNQLSQLSYVRGCLQGIGLKEVSDAANGSINRGMKRSVNSRARLRKAQKDRRRYDRLRKTASGQKNLRKKAVAYVVACGLGALTSA